MAPFHFQGVSDRAKRKLNRSGSQESSNEPSPDGLPLDQFSNQGSASPANRRKPERPPPPGPKGQQSNAGLSTFHAC